MASQSTNALLFGIAIIAFGGCLELYGIDPDGGMVIADAGIALATVAFLSGYASYFFAPAPADPPTRDEERP